ncbi:MAG TPA: RDD family protein [Polyangiaceae bacterium]|jgi:hypothetical protein|nr:RDD family protein [Polyangiaceae bacterium]
MSAVVVKIAYHDGRTEERSLAVGAYQIGRDMGDIVLGDVNSSARHAMLEVQPSRVVVTDTGSTNGTYDPQGRRLTAPYVMQLNQPVRLGSSSITLVKAVPMAGGTQVMAEVPGPLPGAHPVAATPNYAVAPVVPQTPYAAGVPGVPPYVPPPAAPGAWGPPPPAAAPPGAAPSASWGAPPGGAPPPTSPWGAGSAGAPPPAAPTAPSASWGTPQSGVQGFSLTGTPGVPLPTMDLAVWGTRAIGYLIDGLLVGGAMTVLLVGYTAISAAFGGLLGAADPSGGAASAFMGTWCIMLLAFPVAMLGVGIWDRVYLVSKRGFSIGQGVVKIKVVDVNGALLPQTTALIRLLAQIGLSMVPLGGFLDLLWPLWDPRRQTLHDKAVNCFVINNPGGR